PPPPPPPVPSEKEAAHAKWVADFGDKTLRLQYGIRQSDIVVDLGGYEGQWASDIFSRYLCTVHVVEPVQIYAEAISDRFANNGSIHLHQCALGAQSGEIKVSISGDASSAFKPSNSLETAKVVSFGSWMNELGISEIALLKINIEGGEYELLEHLISTGLALKIRNIQVQFHDFVPDSDSRMLRIQQDLALTHCLTYQYTYVWENWQRRD
ncbi:FkbM family methyltransferase, partial [Rhizobium sp. 18055]|uniref:FkbM family methyltransferase n=1 Tax=Rhizobium sp. 18055 TaxID=2681403 RepID=UPI001358B682